MIPKLLLADDSITVQRVIALTFQGEGIEVIAVGDGDQAVDAIDRERPQIVLADLSMPGPRRLRGRRVREALAGAVEGHPRRPADGRRRARRRSALTRPGIDGVLSKPFEPHVATALVRRLLGETPTVPGFRAAESGAVADAPPPTR
jgi:CheY-like chemotaxis protein